MMSRNAAIKGCFCRQSNARRKLAVVLSLAKRNSHVFQAPLHYECVIANATGSDGSSAMNATFSPRMLMVFLHGLLGNGKNLKTFARLFCERHAAKYGQAAFGVLIDLPGHGKSQNRKTSTTLEDCVQDLHETLQAVVDDKSAACTPKDESTNEVEVTLVGHSFGGRVALQYCNAFDRLHHVDRDALSVRRLILLDTVPGPPNADVANVLRIAGEIRQQQQQPQKEHRTRATSSKARHPQRDQHLDHHHHLSKSALTKLLTRHFQMDVALAQWLSTLWMPKQQDFAVDLATAIGFLQEIDGPDVGDGFCQSLRHILHHHPTLQRVDLVRGLQNSAWQQQSVREHVQQIEAWALQSSNDSSTMETSSTQARLCVHSLPNAGHWVHADDLPGLLNVLLEETIEIE